MLHVKQDVTDRYKRLQEKEEETKEPMITRNHASNVPKMNFLPKDKVYPQQ